MTRWSSSAYYAYIKSSAWKARADAAKARAGHRCQVCNEGGQLDAHHRTYERLGCELETDITVLCRECHRLFEFARKNERGVFVQEPEMVRLRPPGAIKIDQRLRDWATRIKEKKPTFFHLVLTQADWDLYGSDDSGYVLVGRFDEIVPAEQIVENQSWVRSVATGVFGRSTRLKVLCGGEQLFASYGAEDRLDIC
jgi:hypothetical protein